MPVDKTTLKDLVAEGPLELLSRPFSEYFAIMRVRGIEDNPHALEAVDYAVRNTVVNALANNLSEDELESIHSIIGRLIPVPLEEKLSAFVARWEAFRDLLASRLSALSNSPEANGLDPARAREIQDRFLERKRAENSQ